MPIDFAARARINDTFVPTGGYGPSKYPTYARMNRINVLAEAAKETRKFVYGLLVDGYDELVHLEPTDASIDRFIRDVNPVRLKPLQIVRQIFSRPFAVAVFRARRLFHSKLRGHIDLPVPEKEHREVLVSLEVSG